MKRKEQLGDITLYNGDCMDFLRQCRDNEFELAIVDPPYGLPKDSSHGRGKLKDRIFNKGDINRWDTPPTKEYFDELLRVCNNAIIWGGNYFGLPRCRGFIVWDKVQPWENFSQVEYAWTTFERPSKLFRFDNRTTDKFHPTQKPVELYKWLLYNYAKEGDKILDTHLGSGSIAIACHDYGYNLTGIELDTHYFDKAVERIRRHQRQLIIDFNETTV